jgi:hypothetical protein
MFDSIIYPIFIIIFSLLIVYAILNKRNNDKLNNNIEKFMNYDDNNINHINDNRSRRKYSMRFRNNRIGLAHSNYRMSKDLKRNIRNNSIITKDFANGDWTTAWTRISNSKPCNKMIINVTNLRNVQDTCDTKYGTIKFIKDMYDIVSILNGNIVAVSQSNKNMSLHIKIYNPYTEGNIKKVHGSITCVVSMFGGNKLLYNFYSFKIYNDKVSGELQRIISTKDFYIKEPAEVYDLKSYNIIVNNYKYPSKYIELTFGTINDIVYDKILSVYTDGIKFAIQRVYKSPTDNYITTKLSSPMMLKVMKDKTIPNEIKITSFKQDFDLNGLKSYFQPHSTIVYFYKFDKLNETYDFKDTNMVNLQRSAFNFKNNSENMYEPNIKFNNLNTVRKTNTSTYKIQKIAEILSPSLSFVPVIPFSNLYNLL